MFVDVRELILVTGVSDRTVRDKIKKKKWRTKDLSAKSANGKPFKAIFFDDLPRRAQLLWLQHLEQVNSQTVEPERPPELDSMLKVGRALMHIPHDERDNWYAELTRQSRLIQEYDKINPKSLKNPITGLYEFTTEVTRFCEKFACADPVILAREPSRGKPRSPHSLNRLLREFRKRGPVAFLRFAQDAKDQNEGRKPKIDRRKAIMSPEAVDWVNDNYKSFRSPTALYEVLEKLAEQEKWEIPSCRWFQRRWKIMPAVVRALVYEGEKYYQSRHAPYIPRDAGDLLPLQLLCGDHRQADVTVVMCNGMLGRPWVTLWQDIYTGLIWGWHVDVTPSSQTIALAYARGVRQFGAQPPANPETGYQSYVYTDHGRDYRSYHLNGSYKTYHKAARLSGGISMIITEQQIGFYNLADVEALLARGGNAKEKPIERTNGVMSNWEMNKVKGWCGRDAKNRPDEWHRLYAKHLKIANARKGKLLQGESPFISFDEYIQQVEGFIWDYNTKAHTRAVLNNARIVPLDEYERGYTTFYAIREEALALMLMKSTMRTIEKDGVGCSAGLESWRWLDPAMSAFKGERVEVRYDPADMRSVWVSLPDKTLCQAAILPNSGYLKPNQETAARVKAMEKHERKMAREYLPILHSQLRGETVLDRYAAQMKELEAASQAASEVAEVARQEREAAAVGGKPVVHRMTEMDRPKVGGEPNKTVTAEEIEAIKPNAALFLDPPPTTLDLDDYQGGLNESEEDFSGNLEDGFEGDFGDDLASESEAGSQ